MQNSLLIGDLDKSFIIFHLYLLSAVKTEGIDVDGEVILLVKTCDMLEQVGQISFGREAS